MFFLFVVVVVTWLGTYFASMCLVLVASIVIFRTLATLKERGGGAGKGQSSSKVNEAIDGQTEKLLKLLKVKWKLRLQVCGGSNDFLGRDLFLCLGCVRSFLALDFFNTACVRSNIIS